MNEIFKDIKIGDKVFSYYYQKWGVVVDCGKHEFAVSCILDGGSKVTKWYDYDHGSGWLSGHRTQEVFTEEIPPLPADDLSNLQEGDKIFIQPYQKWGKVAQVLPKEGDFVARIPLYRAGDRYLIVTSTGLLNANHKALSVFLGEVPKPSELLTKLATTLKDWQ